MKAITLIFISVFLGAVGQVSMKQGMSRLGGISLKFPTLFATLISMFTEPFVLLGIFLYVISTIFWLTALSRVDLSYAYPMISAGYVFVLVFSLFFLNERLNFIRIVGVLLICGGVFLISRS